MYNTLEIFLKALEIFVQPLNVLNLVGSFPYCGPNGFYGTIFRMVLHVNNLLQWSHIAASWPCYLVKH